MGHASVVVALFAAVFFLAVVPSTLASTQTCPQAAVRPDSWVNAVVAAVKQLSMSAQKVAYLQQAVKNDTRVFTGAQLAHILGALDFTDDKVTVMGFMSPYVVGLNTSEFILVLGQISFSTERLTVLTSIKDTLLNASEENKQIIATTCWSMSSDQQKAYEILRSVVSRDCVFGSVTALSATFVIDVSLSMGTTFALDGTQYTRLSYVKEHLTKVISEQLKPYQQFNVIVFSSSAASLFRAPVNATTTNIKTALTWIAGLRTGPNTNTYAALNLAFSSSPDTVAVYLLSDGIPDPGQAPQIISALPQWNAKRAANRQIRVFSTAFLLGQTTPAEKKESATFMEKVATVTNGVFRNMDLN